MQVVGDSNHEMLFNDDVIGVTSVRVGSVVVGVVVGQDSFGTVVFEIAVAFDAGEA